MGNGAETSGSTQVRRSLRPGKGNNKHRSVSSRASQARERASEAQAQSPEDSLLEGTANVMEVLPQRIHASARTPSRTALASDEAFASCSAPVPLYGMRVWAQYWASMQSNIAQRPLSWAPGAGFASP